MIISELLNEDPQTGDPISMEFGDILIETFVESLTTDGDVVVKLDEASIKLIMEEVKLHRENLDEAEYQGRKVSLGKPVLTPDGPKKRSVYVKNPKGNVIKVNFGDPNMRIKKSSPKHRKSFRARHHCENPGPKTKARYWSCRAW